ncbi:MAG: lipid II flippase MurJ [Candidatus Saccharimonadales bacterium]
MEKATRPFTRVRHAMNRANTRLPIKAAAALLAGSSLLASVLGLFRDRLLNSTYGPNLVTGSVGYPVGLDAYTVAFIIPDFMFFLLTSGALSVTFIPVFTERLSGGNKASAWQLSYSMINIMALLTLIVSVLIIIFADVLVRLIWPGLDDSGHGLAASMMRVIAINPFVFAVASVIASMQQAIGRFTFFALAPLIYNIGIIIGITVFTNGISLFGVQLFEGGIMGVALGVVLGSIMQLIVSALGLIGMGFDYQFKIAWKNEGFRTVLRLLPARSLDQGIDYINTLVETSLASRMISGTIRNYQQALTLHMVPVTLIGVAISTAAFPQMTERLSQGRPDLFRKELQMVLRVIVWLAMPTAVITYFTRGYLASFLFNGGKPIVATTLGILTVAILFRAVYHIASRAFYAQQDTKTPLYISFFTIGLNIALAVMFTMQFNLGIYGLAWAQTIVAVVEVIVLFVIISRRIKNLFDHAMRRALLLMSAASFVTGIVAFQTVTVFQLTVNDLSFASVFPKFFLVVLISLSVYVGVCYRMHLREAHAVVEKLKQVLFVQLRNGR